VSTAAGSIRKLRNAPLRGLLYMVAGVFWMSVMDAAAKWLTAGYPLSEIIFLGRLPMPLFAIALASMNGGLYTLRTERLGLHLLRSLASAATMVTFFMSLRLLPLADTVAITFISPLLMSALSVPILGERVGPRRWTAIAVGFLGVLVILQPSGTGFGLGPAFALTAALTYALLNNLSRHMSSSEPSHTQLFWVSMMIIIGSGAVVPFQWVQPQGRDLLVFAVFAFVATLGQFLVTQALRYAEISLLASMEYSAIIWATLFGFMFWNQLPTPTVVAGAAIIGASSFYIIQREARLARRLDPRRLDPQRLDRISRSPQLPPDGI
jgi:drug/metabolite transporter (DMT)-like permease